MPGSAGRWPQSMTIWNIDYFGGVHCSTIRDARISVFAVFRLHLLLLNLIALIYSVTHLYHVS